MSRARILVIDDERNFREFLGEALEAEGYSVSLAATAQAGIALARQRPPHVVVLDQSLPDESGVEIVPHLRQLPANPIVIVVTAYAQYSLAVKAVKSGALHYLPKPFEFSELLQLLTEVRPAAADATDADAMPEIVGDSADVSELRRRILRVARSPVTSVLVQGESGTGKELVARAIHAASGRARMPLVTVNCAALTETLLLSELFGHERGAFTDAHREKKGLFELAQRGTLFLDEVSEMGPAAQATLLRVLEDWRIRRVGGTEDVAVDVRVVAATNRPLETMVAEGTFRADLYYRLSVVQLQVPSLRARGADVLLLARHFSQLVAARYAEPVRTFSPRALELITRYPWPGNVRELRNAIEHAYLFSSKAEIGAQDLPPGMRSGVSHPDAAVADAMRGGAPFREAKREVMERFHRAYLEAALARTGGNITRAADESGMPRQVFQRLLSRYDIRALDFRPN